MKALVLVILLAGCQSLPSMQYCTHVVYTRDGNEIHIEADCHAPMGDLIGVTK